jgi:hypothetical protein
MMLKDHDFITGFIEIYSNFPCLQKKTDPQYHNKVKGENAYKILLEKYDEYDPNMTKQSVLRRINSVGSAYSIELISIVQDMFFHSFLHSLMNHLVQSAVLLVNSREIVTAFQTPVLTPLVFFLLCFFSVKATASEISTSSSVFHSESY